MIAAQELRGLPDDRVLSTALELAHELGQNAPMAVAATKRIVEETRALEFEDALVLQERISAPVRESADAAEGARAFAERRDPVWRGR